MLPLTIGVAAGSRWGYGAHPWSREGVVRAQAAGRRHIMGTIAYALLDSTSSDYII